MAGQSRSSISNAHLNAFVQPAIHVLATMAGISAQAGPPRKHSAITDAEAVTVMIGIKGDYTGTILFRFSERLACRIVKDLISPDREIEALNSDVQDALGELANVIVGNATGHLDALGIQAMMTPPIITVGKNVKFVFPETNELVVVPLATPAGEIEMNVAFAMQEQSTGDETERHDPR